MDGAVLLAMHTNSYWRVREGLQLDSELFVHALEIATGKQAVVLGKPDRAFFEQALHEMGINADEAVMVGDDIENDVGGAQQAGLRGILVCTGRTLAIAGKDSARWASTLNQGIARLVGGNCLIEGRSAACSQG